MSQLHLIRIRILQVRRIIVGLGVYNLLIISGILFFSYASWLYFQKLPEASITMMILFFLCLGIHLSRPDLSFIWRHLTNPFLEIYMEYAVLIFPFSVTALFTPYWYYFPAVYISISLLPFIRPKQKSRTAIKNLSNFISAKDFEWVGGIRRSHLILFPIYLLALIFSWVKILPLFLLWIITGIFISFYEEAEDLRVLNANNERAEILVKRKLINQGRYLTLLYLPVLIINSFFLDSSWLWINLLFIITQLSLLGFAITFKYALFEPHQAMKSNSIITTIMLIGSLVPFFLPVPFILFLLYYFRAKRNLKYYLHD